jgi:hypothetical protein
MSLNLRDGSFGWSSAADSAQMEVFAKMGVATGTALTLEGFVGYVGRQ